MVKAVFLWVELCVLLLVAGCSETIPVSVTSGVSKALAEHRKVVISDIKYTLKFGISARKTDPVDGDVIISFNLQRPENVILDFRGDAESIREMHVNGKPSAYCFKDEHLIIPAKETVSGENTIAVVFIAGERSLNRNEDYLYTLLVPDRARTLFPCFDQPDMKARYNLSLDIPAGWVAVSNAPCNTSEEKEGRMRMVFAETEPLSTYLFSFVAGRFQQASFTKDRRTISVYHRETETQKLEQLPEIAGQVFTALEWMEEYTAVPYPFAKYDMIILPGFQFGGMEHTGATLYNDKRMFLPEHPTTNEELGRAELIAHETAHMWFGDYVTMKWFDDVWTKEVFANYFAARIVEPLFPAVDHDLNALKEFYTAAYSEDRTAGSNAIKQELDNLHDAGLVYGQIIYNKAPVVMRMLVELMGEEAFREGIRDYLKSYAYANADWEGLIEILNRYTSRDLVGWSQVWVNEKGMPEIGIKREGEKVWLVQEDAFGRNMYWPQTIGVLLVKGDSMRVLDVDLTGGVTELPEAVWADYIFPGYAGKGYGYFEPDTVTLKWCLAYFGNFTDPLARMSVAMVLNENRIRGRLEPVVFLETVLKHLPLEENALLYSSLMSYVVSIVRDSDVGAENLKQTEKILTVLSRECKQGEGRLAAFRALLDIFETPECTKEIYEVWKKQRPFKGLQLNESDYRKMACELAVRLPEKAKEIIAVQDGRISHPDRQREFRYITRALDPEKAVRDSLFYSLLLAENREIEPWTCTVLSYLNHPIRQKEALKYIRPSLEILQEVQKTGDIFFPKNWVFSCLNGHRSLQAADSVKIFLEKHPAYPSLLKNKILQTADPLFRFVKKENF